ncbi:MAG: single-stranded-DNA-specific exonuclease RecJ [Candidatus Aceula meridiana]|nr:single-stranded-DNA-specific exonuclease RecJ [Candidatus Aceula meridiana]
MLKRWLVKIPNPKLQVSLSDTLGVHPVVAQLLINRGIESPQEAKDFLSGDVSGLHDPFLLKDMDKAVARINQAKQNKERVLIFGDYDVDGVTSSTILTNALKKMGIDVLTHIPHRVKDGYGLNHTIAKKAKEQGVTLLITVDCGISAIDQVETLRREGIDVIIVDHHEAAESLPRAVAVVDPKRKDCPYPFGGLAAVAVTFKLAQALLGKDYMKDLDLVALGTIADIVPLRGENRIFVKIGLPEIQRTKNFGLLALMKNARIIGKKITPRHVGFILGPRINAMGRIASAEKSLGLLLSQSEKEAQDIAQILEDHNRERQKKQGAIIEEALSMVEDQINFQKDRIIILSKEGWHKGVVGIVASRVVDTYYRPSIVLAMEEGIATGSARSIAGFHLFDALSECADLLENYGGHKYAAGVTIREEKLEAFKERMNEIAHEKISQEDLTPSLSVDCEIQLSSVNMKLVDIVQKLEPYGEANPEPIFCSRRLTVKSPPAILGRGTLKFWVTDGKNIFSAVGFGMEAYRPLVDQGKQIDIAYKVSIDDWKKEPVVQLELKDIKEAKEA